MDVRILFFNNGVFVFISELETWKGCLNRKEAENRQKKNDQDKRRFQSLKRFANIDFKFVNERIKVDFLPTLFRRLL